MLRKDDAIEPASFHAATNIVTGGYDCSAKTGGLLSSNKAMATKAFIKPGMMAMKKIKKEARSGPITLLKS
jgi:hypothetical protein